LKTQGEKQVIFFSRFRLTEKRAGGGCRRELQVARALSPLNFRFVSALQGGFWKFPSRRKFRPRKKVPPFWHAGIQGYASRLQVFSEKWAHRLAADTGLVIMDNPIFFPSLAEKAGQLGIPMIVSCQNIESLSVAQINPRLQNKMLQTEMDLLSLADLIITLSREEAFFLNNLNMRTFYFPYHPAGAIKNRLLKIRERRKKTEKSGLLLLGTIANRPTLDGFVDVINFWNARPRSEIGQRLIVAGLGTENLNYLCGQEKVECRGPLDDAALDDLLGHIRACLCYQKSGAGVLTKICEMLVAGIPVLANPQSARSYHRTPGLIEFSGLSDLAGISPLVDRWEGNVPIPVPPDAGRLLQEIAISIG
jgi:hypothetical protein